MKITVNHMKNSLDYISVGETITFQKEENNSHDPKAIRSFYMQQFIGYASVSPATMAPGTISGHDVFDKMPKEFSGKVTAQADIVSQSNGARRTALVVELEGVETQQEDTDAVYNYTFKVKGSANKYKGKPAILETLKNSNEKVFLDLALDETEKVVVLRQDPNLEESMKLAGVIEEKELTGCSNLDDLSTLKELLKSNEPLEAKVTKSEKASYYVSLQISADAINNCKSAVAKQSISEKKEELVNQGFEEDLLNNVEEYLTDCGFTPMEIEEVFNTYRVYPKEIQHRLVKHPETLFKDTFGAMKVLWAATANGLHVLESGEKGTGKNVAVETWAWVTQRPLFTMSISAETDKLDLLGSKTIDAEVNESGQVVNSIKFEKELILEAMEYNGILNLDEVNFGSPSVLGVLHSVLDTRREINAPGYGIVKADNNFMVICTINENYLGTNSLNEAFRDRMVNLRFPSNSSIAEVLERACPKASKSDIQKVDKVYQKMYSIIQDRDSSLDEDCMTVRGPIQALQMAPILGLKKAMKVAMIKTQDKEYAQNIENIIDSLVG